MTESFKGSCLLGRRVVDHRSEVSLSSARLVAAGMVGVSNVGFYAISQPSTQPRVLSRQHRLIKRDGNRRLPVFDTQENGVNLVIQRRPLLGAASSYELPR